jgi:hypothetical protein
VEYPPGMRALIAVAVGALGFAAGIVLILGGTFVTAIGILAVGARMLGFVRGPTYSDDVQAVALGLLLGVGGLLLIFVAPRLVARISRKAQGAP